MPVSQVQSPCHRFNPHMGHSVMSLTLWSFRVSSNSEYSVILNLPGKICEKNLKPKNLAKTNQPSSTSQELGTSSGLGLSWAEAEPLSEVSEASPTVQYREPWLSVNGSVASELWSINYINIWIMFFLAVSTCLLLYLILILPFRFFVSVEQHEIRDYSCMG